MRMLSDSLGTYDEAYELAREFVDGRSGDMYTRGGRAEGEQASRVSKAGVNADGGSGDMYTRAFFSLFFHNNLNS